MASDEIGLVVRPEVRCVRCGDVIGVYEPLVHVLGNRAQRSSRAAQPSLAAAAGSLYHLSCFERFDSEAG